MTSYVTPKKNSAYIVYVSLLSQADTKLMQSNPTLATGDVKVSIDGGAFANLATLPVVTPASGSAVKVALSADEMNGDNIIVRFLDAAGSEWCDLTLSIQTTAQTLDELDTIVDAIVADTNELQTDDVPGLISAMIGADADTLETLSDQLDGVTVSVQAVTATVAAGSALTVYRGTTWTMSVSGMGSLAAYDTIYMTAKTDLSGADSSALFQVYNNASGLLYFNGAAPIAASNGVVTVGATSIVVTVQEAETAGAPLGTHHYDVKGIDDNGSVVLLATGSITVLADVTRAIVSPA